MELWSSEGVSQQPLVPWCHHMDSASESQRVSFGREQRTGCPFSGDKEQLDVTSLLCVYQGVPGTRMISVCLTFLSFKMQKVSEDKI